MFLRTLLALILMAGAVLSAPTPFTPKKPSPPPPVFKAGSYMMTWKGTNAHTIFHADKFYACNWQGSWWHGRWEFEDNKLIVTEYPLDNPTSISKWTVEFTGVGVGKLDDTDWKVVAPIEEPRRID